MRISKLLNIFESVALFLLVSLLFYITIPVKTPKNLYISSKATIEKLQKSGIDLGFVDKLILDTLGEVSEGWIYLGAERMNRIQLIYEIASGRNRYRKVTLIPGETSHFFMKQLAREMDRNESALLEAYRKICFYKEGGIAADSYNIPIRYDERRIISYLCSLSERRYRKLAIKNFGSYDKKRWNEILTIASIIEKEAADRREMPLVSSVIYNRLKKRMRLQMDGTLNYGRYSHSRVTPERIRNDKSTYNTYRHSGLPDYPVCSVSLSAIEAALHPAKSDYLYFMKNRKGRHDFSKSYGRHLLNVHRKMERGR